MKAVCWTLFGLLVVSAAVAYFLSDWIWLAVILGVIPVLAAAMAVLDFSDSQLCDLKKRAQSDAIIGLQVIACLSSIILATGLVWWHFRSGMGTVMAGLGSFGGHVAILIRVSRRLWGEYSI